MAARAAGDVLQGRYVLQGKIGEGAFGVVWLATDRGSAGSRVAIKVLHPQLAQKTRIIERFRREAKVLETLDHPNVVKAIACKVDHDPPFMVLEYLEGRSLHDVMLERATNGQHFPRALMLRISDELCGALAHAHARSIVHRDLKPRNVMVLGESSPQRIKVLDFGIAKILETDTSEATTTGRVLGTLLYLAPEQLEGKDVGERADVFAIGTMMFEMLTLARAWRRDGADRPLPLERNPAEAESSERRVAIIERILRGRRPIASDARADLPPELDAVLEKAMAIGPQDRFASVAELRDALREGLERLPAEAAPLLREHKPRGLIAPDVTTTNDLPLERSLTPVMPSDLEMERSGDSTPEAKPRGLRAMTIPGVLEPRAPVALPASVATEIVRPPPPSPVEGPKRAPYFLAFALVFVPIVAVGAYVIRERTPEPVLEERRVEEPRSTAMPVLPRAVPLEKLVETATSAAAIAVNPEPVRAPRPAPKQKAKAPEVKIPEPASPPPSAGAEQDHDLIRLVAQLERLKSDPRNVDGRFLLADQIDALAQRALEAGARANILRCTAQARLLPDANDALGRLGRCVEKLREARHPR